METLNPALVERLVKNGIGDHEEAEKILKIAVDKLNISASLYHGSLILKREVDNVVKIPGKKDLLVIANEEYKQINIRSGGTTIKWGKPGTHKKKAIFILTDNHDVLVPSKIMYEGGKTYEISENNDQWKKNDEEKFVPQPIYVVTLFESWMRKGYSALDSFQLADSFWEGYDYVMVVKGDEEYRLDFHPVSDPDVANVVDERRTKKEGGADYSISFEKYDNNKIIIKHEGKVVQQIELRISTNV